MSYIGIVKAKVLKDFFQYEQLQPQTVMWSQKCGSD